VAIGLVLGLLLAGQAKAEAQHQVDLRWEAPQGCPQDSEVRGRIQRILGSGRHDSPLRAEGTVTRLDTRYHLELVVHVGEVTGTRSLTSKSCDDLAGAAAVEIALLVHSVETTAAPRRTDTEPLAAPPASGAEVSPSTSSAQTAPTAPSTSAPSPDTRASTIERREPETKTETVTKTKDEAEAETAREAPPPSAPIEEEPRSWHVLVQVPGVALGIGHLPSRSVGIGASLGLEYDRWQLQLHGRAWQGQSIAVAGFPGYAVDIDRMGASLWSCRETRFAWLGLSPCLAASVDRISATGTGSGLVPTPQTKLGVSLGAGVQGRIHLASFLRLLAMVAGEVELRRPEIVIDQLGRLVPGKQATPPIYRFAPAALTATLSVEWAL
jgi:hypothetical protein